MKDSLTLNETVRESIALALLALMEEKPFAAISVSEIVRAAGVARSSFYRNFDGKEHVLRSYLRDLYRAYFAEERVPESAQADDADYLLPRFRFVRRHAGLFTLLHRHGLLYYIFEQMEPELIGMLCARDTALPRYVLAMSAGACAGVIRMWIENDFAESEEELTALFRMHDEAWEKQNR